MFLMHKPTGDIIEILTLDKLFNPCIKEVTGVDHLGQEMQDPASYQKMELAFPSGEALPRCWFDSHYRETMTATPYKEKTLVNR
ncbi:MAG: acetyltransferase [Nostocaceae cyanobacterium]|nr:acetyltransferase [Nostocaceae cyanobacterium]